MTEVSPESSFDKGQDEKIFWDTFFQYLDKLSAAGVKVNQDKVVEIAKIADMEAAKRLLFYSVFDTQPTDDSVASIKEIIDFLITCGYIDLEGEENPLE